MKDFKKESVRYTIFVIIITGLILLIGLPGRLKIKQTQKADTLFEFYGRECGPCQRMKPIVDSLEKNENIKVIRFEVWHNPANERLRKTYADSRCRVVPFFINPKTKNYSCDLPSYKELKDLAQRK